MKDIFKTLETCMQDDQEFKLFHVSTLLMNKLGLIFILSDFYEFYVMLQWKNNAHYYSRCARE